MEWNFVTFYSPGTFFAETTLREVKAWSVPIAKRMARKIQERYGATPYAFRFSTRKRIGKKPDAEVIKTSPLYYLGGVVETLEEIEKRNDPEEKILRSNMKCNGWKKVITNTNSWKITQPFEETDVLLEWENKKSNKTK